MRLVHSIIFWLINVLFVLIGGGLTHLFVMIFSHKERDIIHFARRSWVRISLLIAGVRVKVEGRENIPSAGTFLFVCNHQSYLDIYVVQDILPDRFAWIAWDLIFKIPIFGGLMKRSGSIAINDSNRKEAYRAMLEAIDVAKKGESMVIFPEGKISLDGRIGPFGNGAAMLAIEAGIPIIPLALRGTGQIMPKGSYLLKPGEVKVRIGKAITFDQPAKIDRRSYDEVTERIRRSVEDLFN